MHRGYALMACILSSVTTTLAASDWPMQARKHPNSEEPWIIAPWESTWTNSLAICVMIGPYENATDFQEFLQYHQWLGIDHAYVIENDSAQPMVHGMEASIQRFIDAGFVTYSTWPGSKQQGRVYADCDRKYRHLWNWMLYMDADELLHVRDSSQSLKHVLNDYKLFPGIGVHWVQFGSGGHRQRPAEGGMMRHYTRCDPMPQNIVKTIVNTFYVESVSHPHNQRYRGDAQAVNDALVPLEADTDAWHSRKVAACRAAYPYDHDKCLRLRQERSIPFRVNSRRRRSVQRLALFHYVTRSTEDFRRKVARGGGMGNSRTWTEFDKLNRNFGNQDICKELASLADKCCRATGRDQGL